MRSKIAIGVPTGAVGGPEIAFGRSAQEASARAAKRDGIDGFCSQAVEIT